MNGELIRRIPYYQIDSLMIRGKVDLNAEVFDNVRPMVYLPYWSVRASMRALAGWLVRHRPP